MYTGVLISPILYTLMSVRLSLSVRTTLWDLDGEVACG
jgi:hypothetical protein